MHIMTAEYKIIELFCIIDEFYKHFDAENAGKMRGKCFWARPAQGAEDARAHCQTVKS